MMPYGYNDGFIARMNREPYDYTASDAWRGGWFDCDMELAYHARTDDRPLQHYNDVNHYGD